MKKIIYKVESLYKGNHVKTSLFSDKKKAIDFADEYKGIVWQKIYHGKENV